MSDLKEMMINQKMQTFSLKKPIQCSIVDLYNILQDLRHCVLVDLRPATEFSESALRESMNYIGEEASARTTLLELFKKLDLKAIENEKVYNTKRIRRVVVIPEDSSQEKIDSAFETLLEFSKANSVDVDKIYVLKQPFEEFKTKFPFLCHPRALLQSVSGQQKTSGNSAQTAQQAEEDVKLYLYSISRFPTIIVDEEILLGSVYNFRNKRQLQHLDIQSVVVVSQFDVKKPEEAEQDTTFEVSEEDGRKVMTLKFNPLSFIEFDTILPAIKELPGPRLLCCQENFKLSGPLAIAYQMLFTGQDVNKTSLQVFSKLGSTDADKLIYSQVMLYNTSGKFIKI